MKRTKVVIELEQVANLRGEWHVRVKRNGKPLHKSRGSTQLHRGSTQLPALGNLVMLYLEPYGEDASTLRGFAYTLR
jgi:hypothetical protein